MSRHYRTRWISEYGEYWVAKDGTISVWYNYLIAIDPRLIQAALIKCTNSGEEWPPSPQKFHGMCKPTPENLGLKSPKMAFLEACLGGEDIYSDTGNPSAPRVPVGKKWSSAAVFHAKKSVNGFKFLPPKEQEKAFTEAYSSIITRMLNGEQFEEPQERRFLVNKRTPLNGEQKKAGQEALEKIKRIFE